MFLIITLSILFKDGSLSIACFYSCCSVLTNAKNHILLFQHTLHYIPCIIHSATAVIIHPWRRQIINMVELFCPKTGLIRFHKIMFSKVLPHEILQNRLAIFSITIDIKAPKHTPAVPVYHTSIFLSSSFVSVSESNQLHPTLGLHFYFCFLPNCYLIAWTCFAVSSST